VCVNHGLLRFCVNLWSCGLVLALDLVSPFNELILGWQLGSTHMVNRLLKLMNTKCRMLSTKPVSCLLLGLTFHVICS
jgi:hypothetical protein